MQRELKLRIWSGLVMATAVIAATFAGGLVFRFLATAIALVVFYEWWVITSAGKPVRSQAIAAWAAVGATALLVLLGFPWSAAAIAAAAAVATFAAAMSGHTALAWLCGGVLYAGLTSVSLSAIRGDDHAGLVAMLFVFSVVWSTDILAYFVGRALKGPKLAARISPGKTWSGAIGGAVAAIAAGTGVCMAATPMVDLRIPVLALLLSIASQSGDLFESYVKRRFGVKDSGHIIPGHGGIMDRVDGLVFACFAAFLAALVPMMLSPDHSATPARVLLGLTQ